MDSNSSLSGSNPIPPLSAAEENLEKELKNLNLAMNSTSSESDWENDGVVFEFDALPPQLKIMVWKEMTFVKAVKGNRNDPELEQQHRIRYARVCHEWYEIKSKPTKYFIGEKMDIVGLSELLITVSRIHTQ